MATATALGLRIAARVADGAQAELTAANYLSYINDAIDDLVAAGWLLPIAEDVSLTITAATYQYLIPASWAYIRSITIAEADGSYPASNTIPQHQWWISSGGPYINFYPDLWDMLVAGRAIKLSGQKRPSQGIVGGDTITPGMESFVRDRGIAYAAEQLSSTPTELQEFRSKTAQMAWERSERMLAQHPAEFRVKVGSINIPGR